MVMVCYTYKIYAYVCSSGKDGTTSKTHLPYSKSNSKLLK